MITGFPLELIEIAAHLVRQRYPELVHVRVTENDILDVMSAAGSNQQWRLLFAHNRGRNQKLYWAYIRSSAWQRKRQAALRVAEERCEKCGRINPDVHHLTYQRVGDELPEDLACLCRACHDTAHGKRGGKQTGGP